MSDPVLDEEGIIALLKCSITPETVGALQAGAVQAMIDLYDRKVTRAEFIEQLAPCIALYGQVAKIWLLANVESVFDSGDLDKARFVQAREGLEHIVRKQAETVIELVKRLQMCPGSQDALH